MRYLYALCLCSLLILWSSCRNDFETEPSAGRLSFSKDTVYLDTVFSNIGSSTYNLKVYNRSDDDITIPSVRLAQGENSAYRLNVDGLAGKTFENIDILANDSIFIFVETTADINQLAANAVEFLYTDQIQFDSGNDQQEVELVTLIKDAVFLFPEVIDESTGEIELLQIGEDPDTGEGVFVEGFLLEDDELIFTNEKPYVIYGFAAVPPNKTLEVQAGARVNFHRNSGIIVANEGSLHLNGSLSTDPEALENEIIFEGDRLEPAFSEVPGQWYGIWLTAGSTDHIINHTTIKNATVSLQMDSNDGTDDPTLLIQNTQIYNSSLIGLFAQTANISAENVVINQAGINSLRINFGGTYDFKHCTIANYWNNSFRNTPALFLSDGVPEFSEELNATFSNCIIYGNENLELWIEPSGNDTAFNYVFENSLIRFNDFNNQFADNPLYDFDNPSIFTENVFNELPNFLNAQENKLQIGLDSFAREIGNPVTTTAVGDDILGVNRTLPGDAGAYQSIEFIED
ncbi:hypothetical protein GCM10009117_15320 [Gangjinia marincola]|uniref:Uncharacterized protein n=1 Tax=Gangjinia marincola TaxID=578463 RepID=A0ABN1MGT0_9FLAO